jgi:hypothetical protein
MEAHGWTTVTTLDFDGTVLNVLSLDAVEIPDSVWKSAYSYDFWGATECTLLSGIAGRPAAIRLSMTSIGPS